MSCFGKTPNNKPPIDQSCEVTSLQQIPLSDEAIGFQKDCTECQLLKYLLF